jgi:small nuclear ribonucleoprotein (snRNP)-like protein
MWHLRLRPENTLSLPDRSFRSHQLFIVALPFRLPLKKLWAAVLPSRMISGQAIFHSELLNRQPLELVDSSIGKRVQVLTCYGYEIDGILMGIDAPGNCVLSDANETKPGSPDFQPRHHRMILVNGATISIVFFLSNSRLSRTRHDQYRGLVFHH